ncbi:MAG: Uncharacterised protein [Acidimicrobiales bacterium AG-410-I20]|nr:MAG: Uncharacterised protein [Acidimicrobiales bacterium AG-410-I20]
MNSLNATDRLRRLLAVIPWVVDRGGAPLEDISRNFDYPAEQLLADLEGVLFMVGIHPFTPDCLVDVHIHDGFVEISYADWFRKSLRLSAEELLQLIVAGKSVAEYLDTDELGSLEKGLMKLIASSGNEAKDAIEINLGSADRETLDIFKAASRESKRLRIKYFSYGRKEETKREIDVVRLFADKGHWYADAYCHQVDAQRIFRLDRVGEVVETETTFTINDAAKRQTGEINEVFPIKEEDLPTVTLLLPPEDKWVVEEYPNIEAKQVNESSWKVKLPIASPGWLARLFLRLGPRTEILEAPEELGESFREEAAKLILNAYSRATP